jgi:NAD(P)-dependent dehydrogenase (short-subunit alcohol dehydrogenase family)
MVAENKVALVTGAASGIGRAAAAALGRGGMSVICADLSDEAETTAKEIVAAGGAAIFQRTDVRNGDDLKGAVAAAEVTFGQLNVVVANAGTVGGPAVARRLEDLSDEQLMTIINVNLLGTIRTFTAAIPALRRAGGGALSATASVAALTGVAGQAAYSASKGGIVSMVRALAYELVSDSIRVNCVCPGGVNTNLLAGTDILPLLIAAQEATDPAAAQTPHALMNRAADVEEVAAVHDFLVSDRASLINGQAIVCDAGSSVANMWMVVDR